MWAAWQLSVLAMGLTCSDHLQPGWNVARPTAPAARFTSSSCPLPPSNGLVSSGELRLFRTRPAMMNPPVLARLTKIPCGGFTHSSHLAHTSWSAPPDHAPEFAGNTAPARITRAGLAWHRAGRWKSLPVIPAGMPDGSAGARDEPPHAPGAGRPGGRCGVDRTAGALAPDHGSAPLAGETRPAGRAHGAVCLHDVASGPRFDAGR